VVEVLSASTEAFGKGDAWPSWVRSPKRCAKGDAFRGLAEHARRVEDIVESFLAFDDKHSTEGHGNTPLYGS
jgi:hypothetical protein